MSIKKENQRKSITLNPQESNELDFILNRQNVSLSKLVNQLIHQEYQLIKAGFSTSKVGE